MKQRIILSETLRTPGDTSNEHALRRSKRFLEKEVVGPVPQGRTNRPGTIDRELEFHRNFYASDGFPQHASPFSASKFRPVQSHSRAGIREHAETIPSIAEYREREPVFAGEPAPYNFAVDMGGPTTSRHRPTRRQKSDSFCLNGALENVCNSKGRCILQLLCLISFIAFALHITTTNGDGTRSSRSILYDALPWVFRATNISAQQTRSKALWENHIVLSDDNRILIPETFESRWNIEVAPLLENQLYRIWDELPNIQCSDGERVYAGFSLTESESLPATVSFENKCNHDTSPLGCTEQRQVADLRHISIDLPSKSSRSSYSVKIVMKRSVGTTDATADPDAMSSVAKGIVQFHLSDSSKIALVRYCGDRRHHFSDNIVSSYTASNKVGALSLYELKRMYALTSRNRRGASYFTELWDANELSRATFDPMEHSWHPLTRGSRRFRRRQQDSPVEKNEKPSDMSSLMSEPVKVDGEIASNTSEVESMNEGKSVPSSNTLESDPETFRPNNSSSLDMTNQVDLPKVSPLREEDKNESSISETASEPKAAGNEEQKEAQDEDEVLPDIPPEAEELDDDDDSSTDNQSQEESGERQGNGNVLQSEQIPDRRQESAISETTDSTTGNKPPSINVAPREGDRDNPPGSGTTASTNQLSARDPHSRAERQRAYNTKPVAPQEGDLANPSDSRTTATSNQPSARGVHSQAETQRTYDTRKEGRLSEQVQTSDLDDDGTLSQSPPSHVRDMELGQQSSQLHEIRQEGEPGSHQPPQSSLSSQPTVLWTENAGTQQPGHSQSAETPQTMPRSPQNNANRLLSRGPPSQVERAERLSEGFRSTQIPSRVPIPTRADRTLQPPQVTSLRSTGSQTQHEPQSSQTSPNNPHTLHMETPLQRPLSRIRGAEVQQEPSHPNNGAYESVPISPRAHRIIGVQNQLPNRRESHPQIHSRSVVEETRGSRAVADWRALASTNNQQPNSFQDVLGGGSAASHINARRSPQNIGSTNIKTRTPHTHYA